MPVRILLMDIDDTLFDFQTGYKRALRAALAQFGVECTPQLLELYGSINDRLWERFERGEIVKDALYDERFRQLFERCGIDASPAACNEAYHNALRLQHDLMPHCEQVLRQLHERYQICIVTNGSTDIQTRRIADSGMAKYFDRVFISEQMGCKKPDKLFYDKVFAEIGEDREIMGFKELHDTKTPMNPDEPGLGPVSNQLVMLGSRSDGRGNFSSRFASTFGTINAYGHASS